MIGVDAPGPLARPSRGTRRPCRARRQIGASNLPSGLNWEHLQRDTARVPARKS